MMLEAGEQDHDGDKRIQMISLHKKCVHNHKETEEPHCKIEKTKRKLNTKD